MFEVLLMWLLTCLDGDERFFRNADGDIDAADEADDDPAESWLIANGFFRVLDGN